MPRLRRVGAAVGAALALLLLAGCEEMVEPEPNTDPPLGGRPAAPDPEPDPPKVEPPVADTRPTFVEKVSRIEIFMRPPATGSLDMPTGKALPEATGGEGGIVYTASGLPGDFALWDGRVPGPGNTLVGRPHTAGIGEYPIVYTAHDSDANRTDEDSDTMHFVLAIVPRPVVAGPTGGVLRDCPHRRESSATAFNILVEFGGKFDQWLQDEVNCAAAYWETAITADIGPVMMPARNFPGCRSYADLYHGRRVDDLMIVVHFSDQAAPATAWTCQERPGNGLPATARIAFSSNSERYDMPRLAAQPNVFVNFSLVEPHLEFLYNLARHEIGHALGFGLSSAFEALVSNGSFSGQNAIAAWGSPVPLDGVHWRDARSDIMYSRIFASQTATRVTIGAMDDIGYTVDYQMAGR